MRCNEARDLLEPYFDGEATAAEREAVDRHLAGCDACRSTLDELRLVWGALDAYPEPELSPLKAEVLLRVASTRDRRVVWRRTAAAIAAVALFAIALWSFDVLGPRGPGGPSGNGTEFVADGALEFLESLEVLESIDLDDLEFLQNLDYLEEPPPDFTNGAENG